MGRGILLWLLGVPIPIILLLALCSHHWRAPSDTDPRARQAGKPCQASGMLHREELGWDAREAGLARAWGPGNAGWVFSTQARPSYW